MLFLTSNESDVVFRSAVVAAFSNRKKARVKIHHSAGYRWVSEFESLGPDSALIFLTVLAEKEIDSSQQKIPTFNIYVTSIQHSLFTFCSAWKLLDWKEKLE